VRLIFFLLKNRCALLFLSVDPNPKAGIVSFSERIVANFSSEMLLTQTSSISAYCNR